MSGGDNVHLSESLTLIPDTKLFSLYCFLSVLVQQPWNHLWNFFVFKFVSSNCCCNNWTTVYNVFQWNSLQVSIKNSKGIPPPFIFYLQMSSWLIFLSEVVITRSCAVVCYGSILFHSGYVAVFITPSTWSFYLTSVLIGIGAASKSGFMGSLLCSLWYLVNIPRLQNHSHYYILVQICFYIELSWFTWQFGIQS